MSACLCANLSCSSRKASCCLLISDCFSAHSEAILARSSFSLLSLSSSTLFRILIALSSSKLNSVAP